MLRPGGGLLHLPAPPGFADDEPIVTAQTWLPLDRCAFIMGHGFSTESMYSVLALNDRTRICRVNRVPEAVATKAGDAENLNLRRGKPIPLSTTIGYNRADEPIEYFIARCRGDRNRFEVDLLIDPAEAVLRGNPGKHPRMLFFQGPVS